jgi:tetrapyrrole methylase family protein / MazG family protein
MGMNTFATLIDLSKQCHEKCPWHQAQTITSLKKELLSEVEEVAHAIEHNTMDNLKEELGDLLWEIVVMTTIAQKKGQFTMEEVLEGISQKVIRRHPHVFGDKTASTVDEALEHFHEEKRKENHGRTTN